MRRILGSAAMLLLIITGCGSNAASGTTTVTAQVPVTVTEAPAADDAPGSTTSAVPDSSVAPTSDSASAAPLGASQTFSAPNGETGKATVYAIDTAVPPEISPADPTRTAIDVEVCLIDAGGQVSSAPWYLTDATNGRYQPETAAINPPLPAYPERYQPATLAAGDCVRGWIVIEAPPGVTFATVRYAPTLSTGQPLPVLVWSV